MYKNPPKYQVYQYNFGTSPRLVQSGLTRHQANIMADEMRHNNDRVQFQVWNGNNLKSSFGLSSKGTPTVSI